MSKPLGNQLLDEVIGRHGFARLRVYDLCLGSPLVEVVTEKLNRLDNVNFAEQALAADVRFLLEVLRETLAKRYAGLSVLAFAHILVALDHVVRVKDTIPDTLVGGYADDLEVVRQVLVKFEQEFSEFRAWKARTGDVW